MGVSVRTEKSGERERSGVELGRQWLSAKRKVCNHILVRAATSTCLAVVRRSDAETSMLRRY